MKTLIFPRFGGFLRALASAAAAATLAASLAACGEQDAAQGAIKPGEIVVLKSPAGQQMRLERTEGGWRDADHPDNLLMFDIFGTFCPPCRAEAPELFELASKNPRLSLVALSYLEKASDEKIRDFQASYNAYYFISNDARNRAIVAAITDDINYAQAVQLPLKVLLAGGKYQDIAGEKFFLGADREGLLKSRIYELLGRLSEGK